MIKVLKCVISPFDTIDEIIENIFQELLFCETCDCVFCSTCTAGSHIMTPSAGTQGTQGAEGGASSSDRNSSNSDHTVIPFSIAIKRMSEILLYKANECTSKVSRSLQLQR